MSDPRLDRIPEFDEKSKQFPIRTLLPQYRAPRSYTWRGYDVLDQGQEGACVGFGWAHELMARPVVIPGVTAETALGIYHRAQQIDEYPGEDYSGTSVLAGAKALVERGYMAEYRWGFSLDDLIMTLGYHGPVVLGIDWMTGMMEPGPDGLITPTGRVEGGHCVSAQAISIKRRLVGGPNSWGESWGDRGWWWMNLDDMGTLLERKGEQAIPTRRLQVPL